MNFKGRSRVHGNLTIVRGDNNTTTTYNTDFDRTESGLATLSSQVAFSALHDSEARYPQPNVLPGTREEIIQTLTRWIEDPSKKSRVYWIHGAVGVGKSAIAQTLSEKYIRTGQLAAAFFFSRNDPTRDKLDPFVATICYQLATSKTLKPLIAPLLDHTIRSTPDILHKDWEHQFRTLTEEPCAHVDPRHWSQLPQLVIIDGVDECIKVRSQERLLQMIQNSTPTLPFNFLIFSRPEPHISHIFRHKSFIPRPLYMALGDFTVWNDIERYLCLEFARIREKHWHTLPSPQALWPGDSVIQQLLHKATGQFIYVTTAMKYVDTGEVPITPGQRLEVIICTKGAVESSSPYADLDLLYSQILHFCVKEDGKLQKILRLIVSPVDETDLDDFKSPFRLRGSRLPGLRSLWALEQFLELSEGEAAVLLSGLHSILSIPLSKTANVEIMHASFSEFLVDQHRAGVYYVGTKCSSRDWRQMLITCQLRMLSRLCNKSKCWPMHSFNYPVNGVDNVDIGSLNFWKILRDNLKAINIGAEITLALNAFNPYVYLTTLLHWTYEFTWSTGNFTVSLQGENTRNWQYHAVAVRHQITFLYSAFQLLKKLHKSCLNKFIKRCASFFRGFYLSFPTDQDKKSVQYTLLACQLSISRLYLHFPTIDFRDVSLVTCLKPLLGHFDMSFKIVPCDNDDERPRTVPESWEVKYIDPAEGQLLQRLLDFLMNNPVESISEYQSEMARLIMDILTSCEPENWTYRLAQLDWRKMRKTYFLGKLMVHMGMRWNRLEKNERRYCGLRLCSAESP